MMERGDDQNESGSDHPWMPIHGHCSTWRRISQLCKFNTSEYKYTHFKITKCAHTCHTNFADLKIHVQSPHCYKNAIKSCGKYVSSLYTSSFPSRAHCSKYSIPVRPADFLVLTTLILLLNLISSQKVKCPTEAITEICLNGEIGWCICDSSGGILCRSNDVEQIRIGGCSCV